MTPRQPSHGHLGGAGKDAAPRVARGVMQKKIFGGDGSGGRGWIKRSWWRCAGSALGRGSDCLSLGWGLFAQPRIAPQDCRSPSQQERQEEQRQCAVRCPYASPRGGCDHSLDRCVIRYGAALGSPLLVQAEQPR